MMSSQVITQYDPVHIGIATYKQRDGLMVPVIRHAEDLRPVAMRP